LDKSTKTRASWTLAQPFPTSHVEKCRFKMSSQASKLILTRKSSTPRLIKECVQEACGPPRNIPLSHPKPPQLSDYPETPIVASCPRSGSVPSGPCPSSQSSSETTPESTMLVEERKYRSFRRASSRHRRSHGGRGQRGRCSSRRGPPCRASRGAGTRCGRRPGWERRLWGVSTWITLGVVGEKNVQGEAQRPTAS
jgi:hypothetical protein